MSSVRSKPQVRKRRVFYIPGYDPIHPRRYRELYRKESSIQAEISGYDIAVRAKSGDGPYGWHITSTQDGTKVQTDIEVLLWSDIVRNSMDRSIPATYLQLLQTAWIYASTGTLWRLMTLRKGPVIAALYPVGMLVLQVLIAGALSVAVLYVLKPMLWWTALAPAVVLFWALLRWFRKVDNKLFAYYLMHDYAHSARLKGSYSPDLQSRLDAFTDLIDQATASDADEILIVGHSSGAHLGASVMANLLRRRSTRHQGPTLSFLTLGQVVPMMSFLPNAHKLRADLKYLSEHEQLTWIDVSAPGDGCTFALCDPVAVSGVAGPAKRWPLVLSAAFTQTLSPETWTSLRWRFFRLHFQYLCAFDKPGEYDYFRITAGPLTLGQRFAGRAPSKSRVERSVSKYTTVTA